MKVGFRASFAWNFHAVPTQTYPRSLRTFCSSRDTAVAGTQISRPTFHLFAANCADIDDKLVGPPVGTVDGVDDPDTPVPSEDRTTAPKGSMASGSKL